MGVECHRYREGIVNQPRILRTDDDDACRHLHAGRSGEEGRRNPVPGLGRSAAAPCDTACRWGQLYLQREAVGFLQRNTDLSRPGGRAIEAMAEMSGRANAVETPANFDRLRWPGGVRPSH